MRWVSFKCVVAGVSWSMVKGLWNNSSVWAIRSSRIRVCAFPRNSQDIRRPNRWFGRLGWMPAQSGDACPISVRSLKASKLFWRIMPMISLAELQRRIDTADLPTEMGSKIYKDWRPRADAPVVMMLKAAGASVMGKTTTTGFASRDPTATLNPRNPNHTPGGSSSGSAAAVAAGMIPLALGTQTGGSVIRPASFCGVAAIKPSFRLLPTVGVKCFSWTLDTVGLFAAGVNDVARGLAAMTGRPELR